MIYCKLCDKSIISINQHLFRSHPEITLYQYKKQFKIDVDTIDILMDKLDCRTQKDLALMLGASSTWSINNLKKNIHGRTPLQIAYKFLSILLKNMPEPELKKSLREFRFFMNVYMDVYY